MGVHPEGDTPYRQPAERPPEPPTPTPAPVKQDVKPARDDAATMWVSDSDARERDESRVRLANRVLAAVLVVVVTILFSLFGR